MTPCNHAFCKECIERMLRVKQKSDVDCPICKNHVNRRSLRQVPSLCSLAHAFQELAKVYQSTTGKSWDDPDDDDDGDIEPISKTPYNRCIVSPSDVCFIL